MCGSDAVPVIMAMASVTIFHESKPPCGLLCRPVSAFMPAKLSVGAVPTPSIGSSSAIFWTASPYEKCGMMPKPCLLDIQITGTR